MYQTPTSSQTQPEVQGQPRPEHNQQLILIVDDNAAQLTLLKRLLNSADYANIEILEDSKDALSFIVERQPDLILLDLNMPYFNGFDILAQMEAALPEMERPPVVVLTADERQSSKQRALDAGAADVMTRPFNLEEIKLKVRNLLQMQALQQRVQASNVELESLVSERTRQLELAQVEMLTRLARVAEYRDDEAGEHIWRVSRTAGLIAQEMGQDETFSQLLTRAARLHDVGKIAIPDGVLFKPGKLTDAEFSIIKQHTAVGASLLSGGQSDLLRMAESVALNHHERWDGSGYPNQLKGAETPLEGRIVAVADAFDAMTHNSAHRKALSLDEAAGIITEESGKQFDPEVVSAFLRLHEKGATLI